MDSYLKPLGARIIRDAILELERVIALMTEWHTRRSYTRLFAEIWKRPEPFLSAIPIVFPGVCSIANRTVASEHFKEISELLRCDAISCQGLPSGGPNGRGQSACCNAVSSLVVSTFNPLNACISLGLMRKWSDQRLPDSGLSLNHELHQEWRSALACAWDELRQAEIPNSNLARLRSEDLIKKRLGKFGSVLCDGLPGSKDA
jgi:hypothetical protein